MATFTDQNGRQWVLKIDAPTIHEVRKELAIDLAKLDEQTYAQLLEDPVLLVDVLWIIVRKNAGGTTDRQFGEALCGDAIDQATRGLLDAIADFFPQRKRLLLRSLGEKNAAMMDRMLAAIENRINDPEMASEIEQAMLAGMDEKLRLAVTRLKSASSAPGSAESAQKD